ncbi:TPA: hypothetical protein ACH3X2_012707 [Trebouxia sp. C0005]
MAATQTDRVGTVWRDDMWLSNYPLNHHTAVDYFACSPFWDPGCNNGRARLEQRALTDLQGIEYTLDSCQEPHLFVICKQDRQSADAAVPVMFYYILDGSVYQTPTIHGVLSARLVWACPVCRALVKFYCSCITKAQVPVQQAVFQAFDSTLLCFVLPYNFGTLQLGRHSSCLHIWALANVLLTGRLHLQSRCMYSVQSAFLRLQKDLDPLTKSVPAPSKLLSLPSLPTQHSKLQMRRVPSNEDMHSTNRIISHVLRKKALAARGRQQQQSSMLSSEPSEFHLPQIRANTPAVSGAPQS